MRTRLPAHPALLEPPTFVHARTAAAFEGLKQKEEVIVTDRQERQFQVADIALGLASATTPTEVAEIAAALIVANNPAYAPLRPAIAAAIVAVLVVEKSLFQRLALWLTRPK